MKEFIDNLISRLGKESDEWLERFMADSKKGHYNEYADGSNDAFDEAISIVNELAEEYNGKYVGIGAFEQVRWERDIAIEQLHELGYEFGQKIDKVSEMPTGSEDCCEWRLIDYEANVYDTTCRNPHILLEGSPTDNSYEFCPYCGKKIKVAPYTEGE